MPLFAEYSLFYRALLQKRPILVRSLLIVAIPYQNGALFHKWPIDVCRLQHDATPSCSTSATTHASFSSTHCNTLQHTATHCNTLQHMSEPTCSDGTQCTTLQLTATYCNALQHTTALASLSRAHYDALQHDGACFSTGAHCNTLQHTRRPATHATRCACFLLWRTLQHTVI